MRTTPCTALLAAAFLATLLAAASCGDDGCEQAYDKMMSCVDGLNCNKLDPQDRSKCESTRKQWDPYKDNRDLYIAGCSQSGQLQTEADKIASCALDPRTCQCPN